MGLDGSGSAPLQRAQALKDLNRTVVRTLHSRVLHVSFDNEGSVKTTFWHSERRI